MAPPAAVQDELASIFRGDAAKVPPSARLKRPKSTRDEISDILSTPGVDTTGPGIREAPGFGSRILERAGIPTTGEGWKQHYIRGPIGVALSPFSAIGETVDTAAEALGKQRPVAPGISTPGGTPSMSLGEMTEQAAFQAPLGQALKALRARMAARPVAAIVPPPVAPKPPLALPPATKGVHVPGDVVEGQVVRSWEDLFFPPKRLTAGPGTAGELPPHIDWRKRLPTQDADDILARRAAAARASGAGKPLDIVTEQGPVNAPVLDRFGRQVKAEPPVINERERLRSLYKGRLTDPKRMMAEEPPPTSPTGRTLVPEGNVEKVFGIEMEPGKPGVPRFEATKEGQQGLLGETPRRVLPSQALKAKMPQADIKDTGLFGQARAARERALETGQEQLPHDPQRAAVQEWLTDQLGSQAAMALAKAKSAGVIPPAVKAKLQSLGIDLADAWDVTHAEVPKASSMEKLVGLSTSEGRVLPAPSEPHGLSLSRGTPFQRAGGFEHGVPNLADPDDVYSLVKGAGGIKITEDLGGELKDVSAFFKNKNGRTLDAIAEGLADEYPALGTREEIKEKLLDTLRRYPAMKADKRAAAAEAQAEEAARSKEPPSAPTPPDPAAERMRTDIKTDMPPGDVQVSADEWKMMGPIERQGAIEWFREVFTDEAGRMSLSMFGGASKGISRVSDDLRALLAPASRGEKASLMAGILRPNLADLARKTETAHAVLKKSERWMEGLTSEQQLRFIDGIETGRVPKTGSTAATLKEMLADRRQTVQNLGTGKLEHFIEDYFPHLWKDPGKAADAFAQAYGRRPLGGTGAFLKPRTIPTVQEGVALGLEPVTTNPVTATLLKIREMDRYVMGQKILQEMKDTGLARLVAYDARSPAGWSRIHDKIVRAGSAGQYWAPEPAARLLNNHLTPGLQGHALFDAYRGVGNFLNQMQLGFSAFHLGFVSFDVMQSQVALGLQNLLSGHPVQAAKLLSTSPLAPFTSVMRGSKMLREYYAAGSQGQEIGALVDALVKGGGRARMDRFYGGESVDNFMKALKRGSYGKAGLHGLPAMMEAISKPVMEWYVPRAKMGVFSDLAKFELSKLSPQATRAEAVKVLGRAWDSVENRLGQLTYDNLFWDRTLKDGLIASVRSVGWNLGTLRELGGGIGDIGKQTASALRGRGFEMTPRMAYTATLPFVTALMGGIYQYLATGSGPETLKDYFYPKNGQTRKDGNPDRVSLPTYMKDVAAYARHPWATVKHKLSPTLGLLSEMLENETYYGANIRNPDDPIVTQMRDIMDHVLGSAESFSMRTYQQQMKQGASTERAAQGFIGITPAPAEVVRTPEQQAAMERRINRQKLGKKRKQDESDPGVLSSIEGRLRAAGYLR